MDDAIYDLEMDEQGAKPRRPGLPVEPRRVLRILAADKRRLARAFLSALTLSLVVFLLLPKIYESKSVLLYEGSPLVDSQGNPPAPSAFVETAVAPSQLREVRNELGLEISLRELREQVDARLESETSIVLTARAGSAEEAHDLAEALLDVFLEHQADFNAMELKRMIAENDASLERAKQRRDAAQKAFDAFREQSGRPDLLEEKDQLIKRAADLRAAKDEAAIEVAAQKALIEELEAAKEELPRQIVASARKGSAIEGPLGRARSELAEARATLSDAHPRVLALKEQVARLQAQRGSNPVELSDQTLTVNPSRAAVDQQLATARAALAAAEERASALGVLLEDVRRETQTLAPEEGEARQVVGELEAAIARVEELTQWAAELRDGALHPITGFRVLSNPVSPEHAQRDDLHVVLTLAFPFLVVLIFAIVLIVRKLRGLTVVAPREVAWWGKGPVLGTSIWPRDPKALDAFVDELEDYGIYGVGRTLVVPATEVEREIAWSFALRLANAPWLAAAILDVEDRSASHSPLVTPAPNKDSGFVRNRPRRLSAQGVGSARPTEHKPTIQGFVPPTSAGPSSPPVVTPPPKPGSSPSSSSRPPRKKTVVGLPAVGTKPGPSTGPEPFRRMGRARANVRMILPVDDGSAATEASNLTERDSEEQAFLLTRPVPPGSEEREPEAAPSMSDETQASRGGTSNAVVRAAVRLLGDDGNDTAELRRSAPPSASTRGSSTDQVTGVALAWNGPLSGPVLRRAARLAHRVIVVVSSGSSVVDLAQVPTRLGRQEGVGYVLVNLDDAYVNVGDRVGPVEEFWQGERDAETKDFSQF